MKRCNVLRESSGLGCIEGISRQDLDAARYLVLHRISIRKCVHRQHGISTMGHIIVEDE